MRSYGYSTYFRPPRKTNIKEILLAGLFCLLIPPFGLYVLWGRVKGTLRVKLLFSLVAVFSMTVLLSGCIGWIRSKDTGYVQIETEVYPMIVDDGTKYTQATPVPANPFE